MADNYLVEPNGNVVSAAPDEIEGLTRAGYTQASPEQIQSFQKSQELQTPGAMAETAAEGVARSATFGLSDLAVDPERAAALQEANPGSALLGEGVGFFSPSILSTAGSIAEKLGIKGAGKTGKWIGEYLTAPGLAGKAGEAVGELVGPKTVKLGEAKPDWEGRIAAMRAQTAQNEFYQKPFQAAQDQLDAATEAYNSTEEIAVKKLAKVERLQKERDDAMSFSMELRKANEAALNSAPEPGTPEHDDWRRIIDSIKEAQKKVVKTSKEFTDAQSERIQAQKAFEAASNHLEEVRPEWETAAQKMARLGGVKNVETAAEEVPPIYPPIPEGADRITNVPGGMLDPSTRAPMWPVEGQFSVKNGKPVLTPFLTKATEGIIPGMASGATEFGLYGVGNVISEAALSKPGEDNYGLTATGVLGTIGTSALFGGILGGVGSAGVGLYKAGLESLTNAVGDGEKSFLGSFLSKNPKIKNVIDVMNRNADGADIQGDLGRNSEGYNTTIKNFETTHPNATWQAKIAHAEQESWAKAAANSDWFKGSGLAEALKSAKTIGKGFWNSDNAPILKGIADSFNEDVKKSDKVDVNVTAEKNGFIESASKRAAEIPIVGGAVNDTIRDISTLFSRIPVESRLSPMGKELESILSGVKATEDVGARTKALFDAYEKFSDISARSETPPRVVEEMQGRIRKLISDESMMGRGANKLPDMIDADAAHINARDRMFHEASDKRITDAGNIKTEFTPETFKNLANDVNTPEGQARIKRVQDFYDTAKARGQAAAEFRKATDRFDIDYDNLHEASKRSAAENYARTVGNKAAGNAESIFGEQGAGPVSQGTETGGLGDLLTGAIAGSALGHAAGVAGHTLSHALGGGALGAGAAFLAHKAIPKLFRYALDNPGEAAHVLSTLYGISQNTAKVIERGAAAAVSRREFGASRGETIPGVSSVFTKDTPGLRRVYNKATEEVLKNANNSSNMIDNLHEATKGIAQYAPNVAAAMATTASLGISYLAQMMPKPGRAGAFGKELEIPASEMAKWLNIKDVVDYPQHILGYLRSGTLTPDLVQALQNVHKDYYDQLTSELSVQIQSAKHPFTGTQAMNFSMLLGVDALGTMEGTLPTQISYATQVSQAPQLPGNAPAGSPAAGKVNLAERIAPGMSKIANREQP